MKFYWMKIKYVVAHFTTYVYKRDAALFLVYEHIIKLRNVIV